MLTDYVVIDLEMTGLNVKTDRILEVGAARVRGNVVTDTFSEVINPNGNYRKKWFHLQVLRMKWRNRARKWMPRLARSLRLSERIF